MYVPTWMIGLATLNNEVDKVNSAIRAFTEKVGGCSMEEVRGAWSGSKTPEIERITKITWWHNFALETNAFEMALINALFDAGEKEVMTESGLHGALFAHLWRRA